MRKLNQNVILFSLYSFSTNIVSSLVFSDKRLNHKIYKYREAV